MDQGWRRGCGHGQCCLPQKNGDRKMFRRPAAVHCSPHRHRCCCPARIRASAGFVQRKWIWVALFFPLWVRAPRKNAHSVACATWCAVGDGCISACAGPRALHLTPPFGSCAHSAHARTLNTHTHIHTHAGAAARPLAGVAVCQLWPRPDLDAHQRLPPAGRQRRRLCGGRRAVCTQPHVPAAAAAGRARVGL